MEQKNLIIEIKTVDSLIIRNIMNSLKKEMDLNISPMQMAILKFLHQNYTQKVYQKDIEKHFELRRSTISGILHTMEKNNLIERIDSDIDARSKEIKFTNKSNKIHEILEIRSKSFEKQLSKDINSKDLEVFYKVTNQIKKNLNEERKIND